MSPATTRLSGGDAWTALPRARARIAVRATLLLAALGTPAFGQRSANPQPVSGWKPKHGPPTVTEMVSAGERAEVLAMGQAIESIFWRVAELAGQNGFELATQFGAGAPSATDPQPIESLWRLWFHEPSAKATAGEGATCIEVYVNRQDAGDRAVRGDRDASARLVFVDADIDTKMAGAAEVRHGLTWVSDAAVRRSGWVTFSKGSAAPWIPVTREEWLRALILDAEGRGGDRETSARKALKKTAYQQWLENAAERKRNIDVAVAAVLESQGRAAADEMRQTLEKTDREVGEQLKAQEAEELERNRQTLSTSTRGDALRAQIAAMSPAERASAAFVDHAGQLVAADDPAGHRLLTPDPAFWRVRRSRAEVHTVAVRFTWGGGCEHPATRAALQRAWQTLDWSALERIVDRP
jgi:hypothetical protein